MKKRERDTITSTITDYRNVKYIKPFRKRTYDIMINNTINDSNKKYEIVKKEEIISCYENPCNAYNPIRLIYL